MNYQAYLDHRHLVLPSETMESAAERIERETTAALSVWAYGYLAFHVALGKQGRAPEQEIC